MAEQIARTQNCAISEMRIKSLEKDVDAIKTSVAKIEDTNSNQNKLMTKLDTMIEFIMEDRTEQKELNRETISTLKNMNDNLNGLNSDMGNIKDKVDHIERKQKEGDKITKHIDDKSKLDWQILTTRAIETLIMGGILGAIYYVIQATN